jgi:hypothetical protein
MTVAAAELATPTPPVAEGRRVVWSGRVDIENAGSGPTGSLDAWTCDRTTLLAELDHATQLVILDAMSFPWETMRSADFDIPVVAVLPSEFDAFQLERVLGGPLLDRVTPYDRLVEPRVEVREQLQQISGLAETEWLEQAALDALLAETPDPQQRIAKSVWRQTATQLELSIDNAMAEVTTDNPTLLVVCEDEALARRLGREPGRFLVHRTPTDERPGPPSPAHVAVVLLDGLGADDRLRVLETTFRRLRPSGRLIVCATVVPRPGHLDETPSLGDLTEELNLATGLALDLRELRSLRWASEHLVRGAIISATSLAVRGLAVGQQDDG